MLNELERFERNISVVRRAHADAKAADDAIATMRDRAARRLEDNPAHRGGKPVPPSKGARKRAFRAECLADIRSGYPGWTRDA